MKLIRYIKIGRESAVESAPEVVLGVTITVSRLSGWNVKIQHEQGHRDGKDAIAQGGEALDALASDPVVRVRHFKRVWRPLEVLKLRPRLPSWLAECKATVPVQ